MKKILILLIALMFNISTSQASIFYYTSLNGLVNAPDSGLFCDIELGNCTYSDIDVNLSFDEESTYLELGVEKILSYSISGADADSVSLSIVSDNEELIPSSALIIDTANKTITVPASAINQSGEVRIILQAKNSAGEVVAQDYTYLNIETINSKNMLTLWTVEAGETIQFPFNNTYFNNTYDGHVDWGDDSGIETFTDTKIQDLTHTYADAGTYEIRIDGGFYDEDSFYCMFREITIPTGFDISQWDTSNVKSMLGMFFQASLPNRFDISSWDTSNVIYMRTIFYHATIPSNFNIKFWDTSKVIDLSHVFDSISFSGNLDLSNWNISNASSMRFMLQYTTIPGDLNLSSWNVSDKIAITGMFFHSNISENIIYNKKVSNDVYGKFLSFLANPDINFPDSTTSQKIIAGNNMCSEEDTSCILSRKAIIAKGWIIEDTTTNTNIVIDKSTALESRWTVEAGETIQFPVHYSYNGIIDWGDGTVEEFDDLKSTPHTYTEAGTYTIWMNGSWNKSLARIFTLQSISSSLDISSWNLSSISDIESMFYKTSLPPNIDLNSWDVSNVTSMIYLFDNSDLPIGFNISSWDVSNVKYMHYMFADITMQDSFGIDSWDLSGTLITDWMFKNATIPNKFSFRGWNLSNLTSYQYMFQNANMLGDLVYDKTVLSPIYSTFIKILADVKVEFPDSTTSQKIYVGDNTCGSDADCLTAETTLTNKGWVITRTTAN